MCADMQYELLLVFVTLLTHVTTKMPIYTNRVQMHFHDTLKYKRFLTHHMKTTFNHYECVRESSSPSDTFISYTHQRKRPIPTMSVQMHFPRHSEVRNISYTHHKKKSSFQYECTDSFSRHYAVWKISYKDYIKMISLQYDCTGAFSRYYIVWKISYTHHM
jgi:hypothetical protein